MASGLENLFINGNPYKLKTHPVCQPNGFKNTPQVGVDGHVEIQKEAYNAMTENITITADTSTDIAALQELDNADVVIVEGNGRKFNMAGAFVTNELKLNNENSELAIDFAAQTGYFVNP